jgi:aminoglycoside phosphotransferase
MSDRLQSIRRLLRRLHRSVFHSVPNDGIPEVDLSKLRSNTRGESFPEHQMDWRPEDSIKTPTERQSR